MVAALELLSPDVYFRHGWIQGQRCTHSNLLLSFADTEAPHPQVPTLCTHTASRETEASPFKLSGLES